MDIIPFLSRYIDIDVATIFLVIIFISSLTIYVLRIYKFKQTIDEISKVIPKFKKVDLDTFDQLSDHMKKSTFFSKSWSKFETTIIQDNSLEDIQIFRTKSFSEFLLKKDFINKMMLSHILKKTSSTIMSFGLLFTFLFIVFGLLHIRIMDTGKVEGIKELIGGLSSKFNSSVLAIFLSITFIYIEEILFIKKPEKMYEELIEMIDNSFQNKTHDNYLQHIEKNISELNYSMKSFGADLAGSIKSGLQEGMGPNTERLLDAIENFEKQKSESMTEILSNLLSEFKLGMKDSTHAEFKELKDNISNLSLAINNSMQQNLTISEQINNIFDAVDKKIQNQVQESTLSFLTIKNGFESLLSSIDNLLKIVNNKIQNQEEALQSSFLNIKESFNSILYSVEKNTQKQNESINELASGVISKAEKTLMENEKLMITISDSMNFHTKSFQEIKELITLISTARKDLTNELLQFKEVQEALDKTSVNFFQQTPIIHEIQERNTRTLEKFQEIFPKVEKGLAEILKQIADNYDKYTSSTKNGLDNYLKQYDESLSKSTKQLKASLTDLDDFLQELSARCTTTPEIQSNPNQSYKA